MCKNIFLGKYDFGAFSMSYPMDNPNVTQGIQIYTQTHDIFTHVKNPKNINHENPNYLIFPLNIYCVMISFIIICTIVNVLHTVILCRHRSELSLGAIFHQAVRNFFDLVTCFFGDVNCHSFYKTLRVSVLLSITFMMALYDSCFSNKSILIHSVNSYDSYKSLYNDPPDQIMANYEDTDLIKRGKLGRPGKVDYLRKMTNIIMTYKDNKNEDNPNAKKVVVIQGLGDRTCALFRGWLKLHRRVENAFVIRKTDPDAMEVQFQLVFSKSLTESSSGKKLLKTMNILSEMGISFDSSSGVWRKFASEVTYLPLNGLMTKYLRQIAFPKCDKLEITDESSFRDVSFNLFDPVIPFFSFLVVFFSVTWLMELLLYFCLKILKRIHQRKMRRCPERCLRMRRDTGLPYS